MDENVWCVHLKFLFENRRNAQFSLVGRWRLAPSTHAALTRREQRTQDKESWKGGEKAAATSQDYVGSPGRRWMCWDIYTCVHTHIWMCKHYFILLSCVYVHLLVNEPEIIPITLWLLLAHFKIAGVMINLEAKSLLLLDHVKTEVSYLLLQVAVCSGPHHPQGMGRPWWEEEGVRWR